VNRFRVRLADGREIQAAMPDEFLEMAREERDRREGHYMAVEVELREPPAMAVIKKARWERTR
jgi:hypothetical protein